MKSPSRGLWGKGASRAGRRRPKADAFPAGGNRAKVVTSGRITGEIVKPEPWLNLQALGTCLESQSKNPFYNNKNEASFTRNFCLQNRGHLCMF